MKITLTVYCSPQLPFGARQRHYLYECHPAGRLWVYSHRHEAFSPRRHYD